MATGKPKEKRRFPKDFLLKDRQFGRQQPALWMDPPAELEERHRMMEAYYQHQAAYAVRQYIELHPELDVDQFASQVGLEPAALRRKLRGASVVKLREILAWADAAGVDVLPPINNSEQLLP